MSEKAKAELPSCSEQVPGSGTWGGFHLHQCYRAGIISRNGKPYCKQHDPVAQQEKRKARHAKWDAESKRIDEQAKNRFEQSRREQAAHEAALELARAVLDIRDLNGDPMPPNSEEWEGFVQLARKVLDLAGEKA